MIARVLKYAPLILLVALWACTSQPKGQRTYDRILKFDSKTVTPSLPEVIDKIDILPLEFSKAAAFATIDKLIFKNGLIYIGDFRNHKVVVYDMSGCIVFVVNRLGRGDGEYLEIKSFAVDDDNIYIIDNFAGKVNIYDCRSGEFRVTKKIPIVAWDIETLANGDFIFAYIPLGKGVLNKSQPNYRIFITDRDFKVKCSLFEFEDDYSDPVGQQVYFSRSGDKIIFSSFQFDGFTVINGCDASEFYHVAIDLDRKIPERDRQKEDIIMDSRYSYLVATPILCKDYITIDICIDDYLETYLYEPSAGPFVRNTDIDRARFLIPPIGCFENKLVSILSSQEYDELTAKGFPAACPDTEQRLREGDVALLFYTLR